MQEDLAGTAAETRKLAAIMFTDVVGFSRQMGSDEARMLRLLDIHNQFIEQAVAEHRGHVIKSTGDGFLVDFPSAVNAVQCAQRIQAQFRTYNAEKEKPEQIHVRIGLHLGDIVQRDGDVFGDGVNVAARLQALAESDTICISHAVYREVEKKLSLGTVVSLGRPKLKNIVERFQVYALLLEPPQGLRQTLQIQWLKLSRRVGTAHLSWAALVVGLLIGGGIFALLFPSSTIRIPQSEIRNQAALPLPDKPSIVVLPFVNMSGDPGQEYFSDGITEELTASLSRLSSLFVISRNSAFFYKGKAVKMPDLSKELGVKYVLEGSLRKAGDQVRITTQLIDATTDHHLWSERYDRPLIDLLALQDEIVQKIVTTLKLQLSLWEQGLQVRKRTDNMEAYDYYLRGRESQFHAQYEMQKEANEQARQLFEKAVELDSAYAEAYAGLGWTYFLGWFYQWNSDPVQALERAFELAQQAITLNGSLPWPHEILGSVYVWKKQHEQAITEAERAIALDPNWADAYVDLAAGLVFGGRPDGAIRLIEKAMRLNPHYPPGYLLSLGWAHRMAGQYERAVPPLKKLVILTPNFVPAHFNLAICYAELGRMEEARAEAAELLRLSPRFSVEAMRQFLPFKDPADLERTLDGLRKAGLK